MTKLIIYRGLPGCGKTTHARAYIASRPRGSVIRLNRDDLRRMTYSDYRAPENAVERRITTSRDASLEALLRAGCDVIADDTNLRSKYVRDLLIIAREAGAEVEIIDMTHISVETCIAWDAKRTGAECVGADVIVGMHRRYLAQHHGNPLPVPEIGQTEGGPPRQPAKPYVVPAWPVPHAFLVDLDGTLALMNGRGPYDESCVIDDLPNTPVIETVRALIELGWDPIFMSGRTDGCRDDTEVWLLKHVFGSEMMTPRLYAPLLMRAAGDTRPDSVVKLELFNAYVRNQYNVRLVLDDRDSVVAMWRSLGLTCLQVAPGAF
jgi:predicted kinase